MKKTFLFIFLLIIAFFLLDRLEKDKKTDKNTKLVKGRWHVLRKDVEKKTLHEKEYEKLIGLGYLEGYKQATAFQGVTTYKKGLAYEGLNFFVSGHAPQAILMDMNGNIMHTWQCDPAFKIWHDAPQNDPGSHYWRRAYLFKNGDILAIYEGIGMIKLDKNSQIIWKYRSAHAPHHDMEVLDNGTIYVLTRGWKKIPHISTKDILEEYITILNADGKLIKEYSLIDIIEHSQYARMLKNDASVKIGGFYGHILHSNTIEVFNGSLEHFSPLFKKGNVLISFLINHTICIIDLNIEQVVWALGNGLWRHQHQPTLLDNGHMLIFDNKDTDNGSAIKEFDPFTQKIFWIYKGTSQHPFYSETCGSIQKLQNNNILITETDNGRAFEITQEGIIVWEYINPYRSGKNKELIASLFEMIRFNYEEIHLGEG
ncbi:MAG: arylsulfotransferase family protein [Candidatus Omnitrophica bacterium]|nr:arylsulfotransferase family protein [Candidatus Omnitrophota bacterium]